MSGSEGSVLVVHVPEVSLVEIVTTGPQGPPGDSGSGGSGGVTAYTFTQAGPAAVWVITHGLGYDPAGVVVTSSDGYMLDGFGIQYLTPGQSLRLSFDLAFAGTARLS